MFRLCKGRRLLCGPRNQRPVHIPSPAIPTSFVCQRTNTIVRSNGYYLQTEYAGSDGVQSSDDVVGEIEGVDEYGDDSQDDVMTLLEMHVYDLFDGIDGEEMDEDDDNDNAVAFPYVITIDYNNQKVVSVRRNWREDDEMKKRRDWFVSYKFFARTWVLRLWPVSHDRRAGQSGDRIASRSARQCCICKHARWVCLRGRVQGGDMQISPGEFVDLDSTVDDVNKAICRCLSKSRQDRCLICWLYGGCRPTLCVYSRS